MYKVSHWHIVVVEPLKFFLFRCFFFFKLQNAQVNKDEALSGPESQKLESEDGPKSHQIIYPGMKLAVFYQQPQSKQSTRLFLQSSGDTLAWGRGAGGGPNSDEETDAVVLQVCMFFVPAPFFLPGRLNAVFQEQIWCSNDMNCDLIPNMICWKLNEEEEDLTALNPWMLTKKQRKAKILLIFR